MSGTPPTRASCPSPFATNVPLGEGAIPALTAASTIADDTPTVIPAIRAAPMGSPVLRVLRDQVGHTTRQMSERYLNTTPAQKASAFGALVGEVIPRGDTFG